MLKGKKAILNTGGNKSWSIASALQDIGIEVVATSIQKATEEDIAIAQTYVPIVFKSPATEQPRLIDEHKVDILLAGGRSLYTAIKKKNAPRSNIVKKQGGSPSKSRRLRCNNIKDPSGSDRRIHGITALF